MWELMRGRTAVVITHRLSLVRELDLIVVLAEGRIVEMGNHSRLMAAQGLCASLYGLPYGIP